MTVKLRDGAPDLAEFASDFAALGPFTAWDLAVQYLDANLATGEDFEEALKEFTPTCAYYT